MVLKPGVDRLPPASDEAPPPRRRGCGGIFFVIMLILGAAWGVALGLSVWVLEDAKTTIQALETFRPKANSKVFAADGELLTQFSSEEHRQLVSLSQIPLKLQKAVVATEDDAFYEHRGVRPESILNAAFSALVKGKRPRGASTITQQVARIVPSLGVSTEWSLRRKVIEAIVALRIERAFTKDEILEIYLNQISLGGRFNGVQSAAQRYFAKNCWELTLDECAMLAGLIRAPGRNDPFVSDQSFQNAIERRNIVLKQMLDNQFITRAEYEQAVNRPLEEALVNPKKRAEQTGEDKESAASRMKAPYFVEEVREFVVQRSEQSDVFGEGLEIDTTLDPRLQALAEETLFKALDAFDDRKLKALKRDGKEKDFIPVTGALVCIDNRPGFKGFVRALVGGRDFEKEKFNTATQARRQPGSSIKPFVWSVALTNDMTPSSLILDAPFTQVNPWGNVWSPKNFGGDYQGWISLRSALQMSVNIVSVKLVEQFGMPAVRACLHRAGIRTPISNAVSLTIALGSPEVTVLDHCIAYSTIANGGVRYDPILVKEIRNRDGLTIYQQRSGAMRELEDPERRAMPANVACVLTHLMEGVCKFGTGANTQEQWEKAQPGRPRAGKTGTSNESRNCWFCGFTPDFTCVVWLGYRDNRPLGRGNDFTGGRLANPIWTDFMIKAEEGLAVRPFEKAEGVTVFKVDRKTGVADGSFEEYFVAGTAPPTTWSVSTEAQEPTLVETRALGGY